MNSSRGYSEQGFTYRDIAEILAEKCAVQVTGSGVHDYLSDTIAGSGEAGREQPD